MSVSDTLIRPLDAGGQVISGLGAPATLADATYVDHTTLPLANGVAATGSSFLAASIDHVHPASGTSIDVEFLLENNPTSPTINETITYSSGVVTLETWQNVALQTLKTIAYTYSSGLVATEVRKVYDPATTTILGQVTWSYTYASGVLSVATMTRDVGTPATSATIDHLLENNPVYPGITYTPTYNLDLTIHNEDWTGTVSTLLLKRILYTYSGTVSTEVRKVYDSLGTTIVGQVTDTYGYAGSVVNLISRTRDI